MAKELARSATRRSRPGTRDDPNRKMALEETPWLARRAGRPDAGELPLIKVLDPEVAQRRARRGAGQAAARRRPRSGAFPWWPGGPPSPYMTLYIARTASRGRGVRGRGAARTWSQRGWSYLRRHYRDEYVREHDARTTAAGSSSPSSTTSPRSYPGRVVDRRRAHRRPSASRSSTSRFKHWKQHSPLPQGLPGADAEAHGPRATDAQAGLRQRHGLGEDDAGRGHLLGARGPRLALVQRHHRDPRLRAAHADRSCSPKDPRRDGLVQWLLLNKKLNHWKSTRATAEVIYALVALPRRARAQLGVARGGATVDGRRPQTTDASSSSPTATPARRTRWWCPAPEVDPQRRRRRSWSRRRRKGFALRLGHLALLDREAARRRSAATSSRSTRRYFRREQRGRRVRCSSRSPRARRSQPGDEVEVQLSLRSQARGRVRPPARPARRRPRARERASRGYKWDLGIAWYEEIARQRRQLLLRVAAGRRVHLQVPPARQHGRHLPRRPGDGAVDVRAGVRGLLGGERGEGGAGAAVARIRVGLRTTARLAIRSADANPPCRLCRALVPLVATAALGCSAAAPAEPPAPGRRGAPPPRRVRAARRVAGTANRCRLRASSSPAARPARS